MARRIVADLLVFLPPAVGYPAEQPPGDLVGGMRVRVTAPDIAPKPVVGTIQKVSDEAIELAVKGRDDTIHVPRSRVLRLEVSRGRNRSAGLVVVGDVVAAAGAIVGALGCRDSADFGSSSCAAILGGFGFALGGAVGAIVGVGDKWKDLGAERFRVTLAPSPGRGVAVSMRFTF